MAAEEHADTVLTEIPEGQIDTQMNESTDAVNEGQPPTENWQAALTGAASEATQQATVPDPLPEADIIQEQQTEANMGDAPKPTSEVPDKVVEKNVEEPEHPEANTEMQTAEEEQLDAQAIGEASNTQPPQIGSDSADDRQLALTTPSSGLLSAIEV